jgi:predicted PurR-regulated permease PerM
MTPAEDQPPPPSAPEPDRTEPAAEPAEPLLSAQTTRAVMAEVTPALVFRWAVAATAGVFVVLLISSVIYAMRDILVLVMIAVFIAVSLDPAVRWLIRHGVRRSIAVSLILVVALMMLAIFFISVVPPLVGQAGRLTANLPGYIDQLPDRFRTYRELSDRFNLTERLRDLAASLPARIGTSTVDFLRRFLGALISTVTVIVLTIYFMADLPRTGRGWPRSSTWWWTRSAGT